MLCAKHPIFRRFGLFRKAWTEIGHKCFTWNIHNDKAKMLYLKQETSGIYDILHEIKHEKQHKPRHEMFHVKHLCGEPMFLAKSFAQTKIMFRVGYLGIVNPPQVSHRTLRAISCIWFALSAWNCYTQCFTWNIVCDDGRMSGVS